MRIKSLLLTLALGVVGSSSVALADHDNYQARRFDDDRLYQRYDDRFDDDRFDRRYRERAYRPAYRANGVGQPRRTTWLPLTSSQRLERGGDVFDLRSHERFGQLRLQNQAGRTYVRQIDIIYADGQRQCVEVHRALDGNHAMINIDLDGDMRRIDKIVVDGRSARDGFYQLYAM